VVSRSTSKFKVAREERTSAHTSINFRDGNADTEREQFCVELQGMAAFPQATFMTNKNRDEPRGITVIGCPSPKSFPAASVAGRAGTVGHLWRRWQARSTFAVPNLSYHNAAALRLGAV
jgi:hypothetical protein